MLKGIMTYSYHYYNLSIFELESSMLLNNMTYLQRTIELQEITHLCYIQIQKWLYIHLLNIIFIILNNDWLFTIFLIQSIIHL